MKRGFLLLEVMVSGVMAVTILGGLLIAMNDQRLASVMGARDASAAMLVQQRIEELNAVNFAYLDVLRLTGTPVVETITLGGVYTRTTTISQKGAAGCREFPTAVTVYIDCHDIAVEVTYQARSTIRAVDATLRLYDPNPL